MSKQHHIRTLVDPVVVGNIGSAYGIRGWLRVFSYTEEDESIFDYQPWFIKRDNKWLLIELESWKCYNQNLLIKIMDIENRETAMLLTNCEIIIDSSQLPNLDSGKYYWQDLLGCQVITVSNYHLGEVIDLMETGSNDVLVVKTNMKDNFGIEERLIPFLDGQVIKNINLTNHVIEVAWDPSF